MITDDWKTIVDWKFIRALDNKPRYQKKLLDQQAAIMELIATEAQYIQKLNLIINVSCLLFLHAQPHCFISYSDALIALML